jgi:hypothetical protein
MALLFRQLEDTISLNFHVFSMAEIDQLSFACSSLAGIAAKELAGESKRAGGYSKISLYKDWPPLATIDVKSVYEEIVNAAGAIAEECRKAKYLHLKADLLEGVNLEINNDKTLVENYLKTLGFSELLLESLNEAERLQRSSSPFDFKSGMGHLRSFLERLHLEVVELCKWPQPKTWGEGLTALRTYGLLSPAEERFATGIYGLISDEAVHPVIAEKEYARLTRNVVIEYGLLLLRKLEKATPGPPRKAGPSTRARNASPRPRSG